VIGLDRNTQTMQPVLVVEDGLDQEVVPALMAG